MLGSLPADPFKFSVLQSIELLLCNDSPVLELDSKNIVYKKREIPVSNTSHFCFIVALKLKNSFIVAMLEIFQILINVKISFKSYQGPKHRSVNKWGRINSFLIKMEV